MLMCGGLTAATPASEVEAVVRSPTKMAASCWLQLYRPACGGDHASQSMASSASAVLIGRKKSREYLIYVFGGTVTLQFFGPTRTPEQDRLSDTSLLTWHTLQLLGGYVIRNIDSSSCSSISGVCVAYCEFPGGIAFQMKRSGDILTSYYHSHASSVPHVASSSAALRVPLCPWTTVEHSDPVWLHCQGTGTADLADLIKVGQLNQMSLQSTLVRQLLIIEHKIDRHGEQ